MRVTTPVATSCAIKSLGIGVLAEIPKRDLFNVVLPGGSFVSSLVLCMNL